MLGADVQITKDLECKVCCIAFERLNFTRRGRDKQPRRSQMQIVLDLSLQMTVKWAIFWGQWQRRKWPKCFKHVLTSSGRWGVWLTGSYFSAALKPPNSPVPEFSRKNLKNWWSPQPQKTKKSKNLLKEPSVRSMNQWMCDFFVLGTENMTCSPCEKRPWQAVGGDDVASLVLWWIRGSRFQSAPQIHVV